jgi:hypothetical protein
VVLERAGRPFTKVNAVDDSGVTAVGTPSDIFDMNAKDRHERGILPYFTGNRTGDLRGLDFALARNRLIEGLFPIVAQKWLSLRAMVTTASA